MPQTRTSAGLLMYRFAGDALEFFLAHPGGPYFTRKDDGHWTIPKGEIEPGEDLLAAAIREFEEETGIKPAGQFLEIGTIQQKGGKVVHAWAFRGNWDPSQPIKSNQCPIEWPPGSGKRQLFPEIDRAEFFPLVQARQKIKPTQILFLDRVVALVGTGSSQPSS